VIRIYHDFFQQHRDHPQAQRYIDERRELPRSPKTMRRSTLSRKLGRV
jgi:hypothetical protein